jgi:Protein of unknown function (DUF3606)
MSHAQDARTVSDEHHELQYVATKFSCTIEQVKQAKHDAGTNEREAVYAALEKILAK